VIQAKVLKVSRQDKKIGLSIRKLEESTEKEIYSSYLNNQREATSNLGELLREEMVNLQGETLAANPEFENAEAPETELEIRDETVDSAHEEPAPEETESEEMESGAVEEDTELKAVFKDETVDSAPEEPAPEETESEEMESKAIGEDTEPKEEVKDEPADAASEELDPENTDLA